MVWNKGKKMSTLAKKRMSEASKGKPKSDAFKKALRTANGTWDGSHYVNQHDVYLFGNYGIRLADYEEMLKSQDGKCAICQATTPGGRSRKHWFVDHDHKTGKVRGLLCYRCNSALGLMNDDPHIAQRAAEYLRKRR